MFVLAWVFLPDLPEYRTGLIIVGLARCIAMVLIWNDLACGDREAAAVLVAINSVFQVVAFGALGWFYLQTLPSWLGLPTTSAEFSIATIMLSVLVFLGIPLLAGFLTRTIGEKRKGRDWYEDRFLPQARTVRPLRAVVHHRHPVRAAGPHHRRAAAGRGPDRGAAVDLLRGHLHHRHGAGRLLGLGYPRTTTLAFTAAGNNFELAIAVAIATFGVTSGQALAGVVGPLIEVPGPGRAGLRRPVGAEVLPGWTHRSPARPEGGVVMTQVLFVCVKNGGKSQMAAGLLTQRLRDQHTAGVEVGSAGTKAGTSLNGLSVQVLAENGVDISDQQTRQLTPELQQQADWVVTLGAEAQVDPIPGPRYETWETDEPSLRGIDGIERMRLVRDDIARHVDDLHTRLTTQDPT